MHLVVAITQLARQGNDLANDQFCDTARVAERRVEHGNAMVRSILQIDLVCPDTEATDSNKVPGLLEYTGCELGLGADPDDMDVSTR